MGQQPFAYLVSIKDMCLALDIFRAFLLGFIIRSSNVNRIEVGGIPSRVKAKEQADANRY